jgi:hypothetical protein
LLIDIIEDARHAGLFHQLETFHKDKVKLLALISCARKTERVEVATSRIGAREILVEMSLAAKRLNKRVRDGKKTCSCCVSVLAIRVWVKTKTKLTSRAVEPS